MDNQNIQIPSVLQNEVDAFLHTLKAQGYSQRLDQDFISECNIVVASSPFCANVILKNTEMVLASWKQSHLRENLWASSLQSEINTCQDEKSLQKTLRLARNFELMRIIWLDLTGQLNVEDAMQAWSAFADHCISLSLKWTQEFLSKNFGQPQNAQGLEQHFIIVTLGKLGANELNYSSDIDLMFVYPEDGMTNGPRKIDNERYFNLTAQMLIRILSDQTVDGFVFRTDLRLRPYGQSGPLISSFSAIIRYYQSQGRPWERYALIKARPLGGTRDERLELMQLLQPFVFRKYVDFSAIAALREMKQLIVEQVAVKDAKNNIKIGHGGIREIEFIAQAWQLIRGGRDNRLRQRPLITILKVCVEQNLLTAQDEEQLRAAYYFLRRVEHTLQAVHDEQTHDLPTNSIEESRLAFAMKFKTVSEFQEVLSQHRTNVAAIFKDVISAQESTLSQMPSLNLEKLRLNKADENLVGTLEEMGFKDIAAVISHLQHLVAAALKKELSSEAWQRLSRILYPTLTLIAKQNPDAEVVKRILSIYEQILNRSAYFSLLLERPMVLQHLLTLSENSPWLADMIARFPVLLDELGYETHELFADPKILKQALAVIDAEDLEARMNTLREFKIAQIFNIAKKALLSDVDPIKVSQALSQLAGIILTEVTQEAWDWICARKKITKTFDQSGFLVVAYGRLGSEELNYHSDLDLVFLYEDLTQADSFIRLAQRIVHLLTAMTVCGDLYHVDSRLRPEGESGLLASHFESYKNYQENKAWTWEHQALVRARPLMGDHSLKDRFDLLRKEIVLKKRDSKTLKHDIAEMREKMRSSKNPAPMGFWDLRNGRGGLIDIEFLAQYLLLAEAHENPEWVEFRSVVEIMTAANFPQLAKIYQDYQSREHRLALARQALTPQTPELEQSAAEVCAIWARLFADVVI